MAKGSTGNGARSAIAKRRAAAKAEASEHYLARRRDVVQAAASVFSAKGVAGAGLAVIGEPGAAQTARRTLEQALAVSSAPGPRVRAVRQLDTLVPADADGVLTEIRQRLTGQPHDSR